MKRRIFRPALPACLYLAMGLSLPAPADLLVVEPVKDNTLYEDLAGSISNGAGEYFFTGHTNFFNDRDRRGLLAFDLTGIPAGSMVTSVSLTLHMSMTISGDQPANLHRVLADWGEGASNAPGNEGAGAPAATGDATWVHRFFNTVVWAQSGGDFVPTASAIQMVGAIGSYTWTSPQMVDDVQSWVDLPVANFGWIIIGNEAMLGTAKRFDSRENLILANRPILAVCFTRPDCSTCSGDMDGNTLTNGLDMSAFVACYLGGDPSAPGCICGDMNFDSQFSDADVTRFVEVLLGDGVCCN